MPLAGGLAQTIYWPNKPADIAGIISEKMRQYSTTANSVFKYRVTHALLEDLYNHPKKYLNGTIQPNATGYYHHCRIRGADCVDSRGDRIVTCGKFGC